MRNARRHSLWLGRQTTLLERCPVTDSHDGTLTEKSHDGHANNPTGHRFAGLGASHY
jgi:hypothetical protein